MKLLKKYTRCFKINEAIMNYDRHWQLTLATIFFHTHCVAIYSTSYIIVFATPAPGHTRLLVQQSG
jgi:hypothetical protein